MLLTSDAKKLISCSEDFTIKIWDFETYYLINSIFAHDFHVISIVLSSDENFIVSSSADASVKVWSVANGENMLKI